MTLTAVRIRTATFADIPAILELWIELADFHAGLDPLFARSPQGHLKYREMLEKNLADPDRLFLLAIEGDRAVGFIHGELMKYPPVFETAGCGYIHDLAVTASRRQRGIGRMLFEGIREWFEQRGQRRIEMSHLLSNPLATAFWEHLGFQPLLQRRRLVL